MPDEGYSRSSTGPKIHGLSKAKKRKPGPLGTPPPTHPVQKPKRNIFTKAVEREQAKRTRTAKLADSLRRDDG